MLRLRSIAFGICVLLVGGLAASGPALAQWGPEPYDGLAYPDPSPAYPAYGEPMPPSGTSPYAEASPAAPGDYLVEQNSSLSTRRLVRDPTGQPPGTIVVDTPVRKLYLVLGHGEAIEYGIGVGRQGFEWKGIAHIGRKAEWPTWTPPPEMLKRRPDLPTFMEGGIDNPLGARALYLFKGKVDTLFRIHGTNEPDTIGHAVSSGCIRMMNADVIDLYQRVRLGTRVVVL